MKVRLLLGMCVFAGGTMLALSTAAAKDKKSAQQDKQHQHEHEGHDHAMGHDQPEGEMDPEMMAAWTKAMTPGEHHQHLSALVGNWTYNIKLRMGPDAPWTESTGTSHVKPVMGGRYFVQKVEGESMGMPFEGMAVYGYDNTKEKYFNTWMDNMGTGIVMVEGTCDNSGKVFTFTGKMDDCMTSRKDMPIKEVLRIINEDKCTFEWWSPDMSNQMFKGMEIVYTRQQ